MKAIASTKQKTELAQKIYGKIFLQKPNRFLIFKGVSLSETHNRYPNSANITAKIKPNAITKLEIITKDCDLATALNVKNRLAIKNFIMLNNW